MSPSTCLMGSTWPTPNPETSYSTSTRDRTIHLASSRTFRNPSTNGCPKSRSMNVRLRKRHLSIRKLWMTADTITTSYSHRAYHSLQTPPESTAAEKSSGTAHPLARTWLLTLDERSLRSSTKSSGRSRVPQNLQPQHSQDQLHLHAQP